MKKFAKLLAMVLAVSMVLTMFVGAFDYKDAAAIDEDKAAAVEAVYNYGIMQGNNKGEFNPKANLTRDEMAKIMFALKEAGLDASGKAIFSTFFDDAASIPAWSKGYIGYAFQNEILVGNANNEVNALGTLTYVEAAIMLLRSLGLEGEYYDAASDMWYDEFTGPKWYQNAVMAAVEYGLFEGLDIVDFKANITREDVAVMIVNTIVLDAVLVAVDPERETSFSLATWYNGVVYGVYTDDDDVAWLELDGLDGYAEYPLGDLDPADYIGYECEFSYEYDADEEVVIINEIEVVAGTVIDTTIGEIAFDENDDEDLAIFVGDEEIALVEDIAWFDLYMNSVEYYTDCFFTEDEEEAELIDMLAYEADNGNANQAVKLIVNDYAISIFYAPYAIGAFDEELIEEGFEDGEWTGEWFYDGLKINENLLGLKDGTLVAAQVIDEEIFIVGFPTEYAVTELTVTYSAKDGYTIALDGEELVNKTDLEAVELWQMTLTEDKGTIIVYNGDLLAYVPFEEEEEEADVELTFGLLTDVAVDFAVNPDASDEEENDTYIITMTLSVVINGVEDVYTYEVTADELPNFAELDGELEDNFCVFGFVDGELAGLTPVALDMSIVDEMDAESIDGVEFEDIDEVWFVDATDKDIELGDIEVKPVEGKEYSAIYVDGNRVNKTDCVASFTVALDIDEDEVADYVYMIVVYDPACEFEPFVNFIAE